MHYILSRGNPEIHIVHKTEHRTARLRPHKPGAALYDHGPRLCLEDRDDRRHGSRLVTPVRNWLDGVGVIRLRCLGTDAVGRLRTRRQTTGGEIRRCDGPVALRTIEERESHGTDGDTGNDHAAENGEHFHRAKVATDYQRIKFPP